ncbi:hypothetical protein [Cerasicoccus arenae]|nr:hypothetical protein [Cerasicoccus arenae]MBK1856942.1 hypothetical protein [Cerasicoccus arenae]
MKKLVAILAILGFSASIATACGCGDKGTEKKKEKEAAVLVVPADFQ